MCCRVSLISENREGGGGASDLIKRDGIDPPWSQVIPLIVTSPPRTWATQIV